MEAAALRDGGCNPMRWRLQPYVTEAATPFQEWLLEIAAHTHGFHVMEQVSSKYT